MNPNDVSTPMADTTQPNLTDNTTNVVTPSDGTQPVEPTTPTADTNAPANQDNPQNATPAVTVDAPVTTDAQGNPVEQPAQPTQPEVPAHDPNANPASNALDGSPVTNQPSDLPVNQDLGAPSDGTANADGQGINTTNPQEVSQPTEAPADAVDAVPNDNASIYVNQAPGVAVAKDPQGNGIVPIPAKPTEVLTVSANADGSTNYSRPIEPSDVLESQGLIQVTDPATGMNYQLTKEQADNKMKELESLKAQLGVK